MVGGLDERRHLPLRPHEAARRGVFDRHAASDGVGVAARGPRLQLHPHRHGRPLLAHARPRGLLPHGLGRQRRAHRAPRREFLRRALRSVASLRRRLRTAGDPRPQAAGFRPHLAPQLHRDLRTLDHRRREGFRVAVAPPRAVGRLGDDLHDDRRDGPTRVAAGVPAQPRPRRGVLRRRALPVGRHVPNGGQPGRAGGSRAPGRLPRRHLPPPRRRHDHGVDHAARAPRELRGPRGAPRRRALPAAVRHHRHHARVRGRGSRGRPPFGRARQGNRRRDDLHVRRPDRRHVVARARAAGPRRDRARRPFPRRRPRVAVGCGRRRLCVVRRQGRRRRPRRHGRAPRRVGRPHRRPAPDHASGEVLREGRQAARDRAVPPVVHPQRRPRARASLQPGAARRRARLAPVVHAAPLRQLGGGPERRLAGEPPALLRRADPRVAPPRRRRQPELRRSARSHRGPAAGRPAGRLPARVHRGSAQPAERVHRRPRHHGHVGDVVAHTADRVRLGGRPRPVRAHLPHGPSAPGARHHPHLAVLHDGSQPLRARHRTVAPRRAVGLDPRSRPQEDVEVQGQRGHADGASRDLRLRRRALLGRLRTPRHRHRVRREGDEGRPTSRDQTAARVEVRVELRRRPRRRGA